MCRRLVLIQNEEAVDSRASRAAAVLEVFSLVCELWKLFGKKLGWGLRSRLQLDESESLLSGHSRREVVTGRKSRLRTEEKKVLFIFHG